MLTARLLTNCSITQRNIPTPERISQVPEREYHKDTCKREAGYFFVAHSVYALSATSVCSVYIVHMQVCKYCGTLTRTKTSHT
jgi:hypothetical protein